MKKYKAVKTYEEINERIKEGKAVVVTAEEILDIVEKSGEIEAPRKIDVVTTGTFAPPSLPYNSISEKVKCQIGETIDPFASSPSQAFYMTGDLAGIDIFAGIKNDEQIPPGMGKIIPSGIAIAVPEGYEAQIVPRRDLKDVRLINYPVIIDADCREEIGVTMINGGEEPLTVKRGDHIGQMVVYRVCGRMDIFAAVKGEEISLPGEWKDVPTGITIALPKGYEAQIRPLNVHTRKGRSKLRKLRVFPVTIDSDYRDEIVVTMKNDGRRPFTVKSGDHIAEMIIYRAGAG